MRHPSLRDSVPGELHDYLDAMLGSAAERNRALRSQLVAVAATLNRIGIVPVALKGANRLLDGLWPDPAFRFMHDIDLLVPEAAIAACGRALARDGWRTAAEDGTDAALHHWSLVHPEGVVRMSSIGCRCLLRTIGCCRRSLMLASATELASGRRERSQSRRFPISSSISLRTASSCTPSSRAAAFCCATSPSRSC